MKPESIGPSVLLRRSLPAQFLWSCLLGAYLPAQQVGHCQVLGEHGSCAVTVGWDVILQTQRCLQGPERRRRLPPAAASNETGTTTSEDPSSSHGPSPAASTGGASSASTGERQHGAVQSQAVAKVQHLMVYLEGGTQRLRAYACSELLKVHVSLQPLTELLDPGLLVPQLVGVISNGTDHGRTHAATLLAYLCGSSGAREPPPRDRSSGGGGDYGPCANTGSVGSSQGGAGQAAGADGLAGADQQQPAAASSGGCTSAAPTRAAGPQSPGETLAVAAAVQANAAACLLGAIRTSSSRTARRALLHALGCLIRQREVVPQVVACMGHLDLLDAAECPDPKAARQALVVLYYLAADKTHVQQELCAAGAVQRLLHLLQREGGLLAAARQQQMPQMAPPEGAEGARPDARLMCRAVQVGCCAGRQSGGGGSGQRRRCSG